MDAGAAANAESPTVAAGEGDDSSSPPDDTGPPHDTEAAFDSASISESAAEVPMEAGPDLTACPQRPSGGDFPLDVAAVLMASCQHCHKDPPINHAPFPLLNYEDVLTSFGGIPKWQDMYHVIQPGSVPHMPPSTAPQLTGAQLQTLSNWLGACAVPVPEGTGGDVDSSQDAASTGELDASGGAMDGG
jgi:hypothetical protein